MKELLKILLSLSISGSLLIPFLFLCKPLFKEKISKQWQYYIWLIVIARLLLPFAPETNLMGSIFQQIDTSLTPMELTTQAETNFPDTDFVENETPANFQGGTSGGEQSKANTTIATNLLDTVIQNIWVIWLIVMVSLFIRKITIYQGFVKYTKTGRVEVSIYTNNLISSPLLIGFFRPCIILPTTELSNLDFEYTILHELTHYKRSDMFYKWLVQIVICAHWFNPLVYLMGCEINRTCELSCDEAVIRKLDKQGRRAYGDTLLNAMGVCGKYKETIASVTLYENQNYFYVCNYACIKFWSYRYWGIYYGTNHQRQSNSNFNNNKQGDTKRWYLLYSL